MPDVPQWQPAPGPTLAFAAALANIRVGTGRPGIEDQLRELGLPVVPQSERLAQVGETVRALRDLEGPTLHTPVVMAVRGPKAQALAAEVADTVTFVQLPGESRVEVARLARDFRAIRDVNRDDRRLSLFNLRRRRSGWPGPRADPRLPPAQHRSRGMSSGPPGTNP